MELPEILERSLDMWVGGNGGFISCHKRFGRKEFRRLKEGPWLELVVQTPKEGGAKI